MNSQLKNIITEIRKENNGFYDFQSLLKKIAEEKIKIDKTEVLEFLRNDKRLGIHSTPNTLAITMANIALHYKPNSAIDICCGTGNLLYYLQNKVKLITGVEITESVASIAKYLLPDARIITADTFQYPINEKYDAVVANLPWGQKLKRNGTMVPAESAFIEKAFELVSDKGVIVLLVPESVLVSKLFEATRKNIVGEHGLEAVISVPVGELKYTAVKTSILVMTKKKHSDFIWMSVYKGSSDAATEFIKHRKTGIPASKIKDRLSADYYLFNEEKNENDFIDFETKSLEEIAEVTRGRPIHSNRLLVSGDTLYLRIVNLQNGSIINSDNDSFINFFELSDKEKESIAQVNDIIISIMSNELKIHLVTANDPPCFVSSNLAIIRSANNDYILSYLKTKDGKKHFTTQAKNLIRGSFIPHLNISDLRSIKIPILPIENLNSLGERSIAESTSKELEESLSVVKENKEKLATVKIKSEDKNAFQEMLESFESRMMEQFKIVNKKLDEIIEILDELRDEFDKIKKLPRDEEEKIFKLYNAIDQKLDALNARQKPLIENYVKEVKRWLDLWELLDSASQKFLPLAEYLFDKLSEMPEPDYSPFVLQYCRSLENEILKKLFESYHEELISNEIDLITLTKDDLKDKATELFAKKVKSNKLDYTIGNMHWIMELIKEGGGHLKESKLLQSFHEFVLRYFEKRILEAEFLKDVKDITNDFRNKAAHPSILSIDIAKGCQELLRRCLNQFLESKRSFEN